MAPILMAKRHSKAFRKEVYLIGESNEGDWLWLEAPSWDCEWYWGMGYVEIYTNKRFPDRAKDVHSHSHWGNTICGFREGDEFFAHPNECPILKATVFTDDESWNIAEIMRTMLHLNETAMIFHRGGSHYTQASHEFAHRPDLAKEINEKIIPSLWWNAVKILSPKDR